MKQASKGTCLITNPSAKGEKAKAILRRRDQWSELGVILETRGPGDAENLAAKAVKDGFTTVIAAGGDGTVYEVLNGIMQASDGDTPVRFGIMPVGTVNVFAKELGMPMDPEKCRSIFMQGHTRQMDLPLVEFQKGNRPVTRFFAQLGGAGLDAFAINEVNWNLKKLFGPFAYVAAGLKVISRTLPPITCRSEEGVSHQGPLVLIGNGSYYGGRFRVFPDASQSDGYLHAMVFHNMHWTQLPWKGLQLFLDSLHEQSDVTYVKSRSFHLKGDSTIPFELEGEVVGDLPVHFRMSDRKLHVMAPPSK